MKAQEFIGFTEKEIRTISDWTHMGRAGEDLYGLARLGRKYPKFKKFNKKAYRLIGLTKELIADLLQGKTIKTYKIESWTGSVTSIKDYYWNAYGHMTEANTYPIIFVYIPSPNEIILNLSALLNSEEFAENQYIEVDVVLNDNEIILNTKGLSIDNVFAVINEDTNKIYRSNITKRLEHILKSG